MKPVRLEFEGFLSHAESTVIDFTDLRAAVIVGPNGSGKTSIVEAIVWCLFGKGRGRGPDDFVSTGQSLCRVAFEFDVGGARYRAERERDSAKAGKSTLTLASYLFSDVIAGEPAEHWKPLGGPTVAETQREVEQVLGLDYDTWLATSFVGQNKADAFTSLRSAERKQLLFDVLQLGNYELLAEEARDQGKEAGYQLASLESRAGELMRDLELAPSPDQIARARETEANAGMSLETLDARRQGVRDRLSEAVRQTESLDRDRRERGQLESEMGDTLKELAAAATEYEALGSAEPEVEWRENEVKQGREALARIQAAIAAKQAELARLKAEQSRDEDKASAEERAISEATERLRTLKEHEGPCFTCGQDLTPEKREEVTEALLDEISTRQAAKAHHIAHHGLLGAETEEISAGVGRMQLELPELERVARKREKVLANVLSTVARGDEIRSRHEQANGRARKLRARLDHLKDQQGVPEQVDITPLKNALQRADEAHRKAVQTLKEASAILARTEKAAEEAEAQRLEASQLLEERPRLQAEVAVLEDVAGAMGRDGIPTLILENAIPEIEGAANHWLERFTDGRFTVRLESQRAKKTGGLKETLDVVVTDTTSERALEELSGGERQCVDLALRLGIAQLLAHRAGTKIGTLILDEAFTALDAGRRQRAVEVIHALTDEFDFVALVTHIPELAEVFPSRIEVSRNGGGSHVEVVTS